MIEVGAVAIVRFPRDTCPTPAVAIVIAYRGELALVAKWGGYAWRGGSTRWLRRRWVPAADIARAATDRERVTGQVIERLPPRVAA